MSNLKSQTPFWNLLWYEDKNILIIEDDPLINIKYVHELQHLFKLIGYDKEIVL